MLEVSMRGNVWLCRATTGGGGLGNSRPYYASSICSVLKTMQ